MGTDSKTAIQQPSSKVSIVSSSSSSKNLKKKKSKTSHHKSKHTKQQRSDSSSSRSSDDYDRNTTSSSKKSSKTKTSKDKSKASSSNNNEKKSSNNKKKSHRSKHDSSESPKRSRTKSRSRSRSDRSSDRSSSRDSSSRYRHKNSSRRSGSNMQNVYAPMSHSNFPSNMPRHYAPQGRGGRMPPYMAPGMMGGPQMRNANGNRRSGGNSPPQSLLGGYRPPPGAFRGRGGGMNNPAYVQNVASMLNLIQQQQKQKPGSHKYANPNNPNNRFYQQFQDNYKKISQGQKVSNLYQASFPVQHIPREMRFNFRLLGRNIFTASDEEEEEKEKQKQQQQQQQQQQQKQASSSDKRSKQRRDSSSSSDSRSDDDRRRRRDDDDDDDEDEKPSNSKSKSSPPNKNSSEQKRSAAKTNRNRTASSTTKLAAPSHELLTDPTIGTFLAGIMQGENPEVLANTLANAAAAVNNKRERTKKQQEKKVQKFKNYARFQQIQAAAGGVVPATNPEEVEKKIHGLARRLQMKTIGLHDDYEEHGMKRSDESSVDSDGNPRRHRSSGSSSDRSKDKDAGSDASANSQRRKLKKLNKRTNKKVNAAGQLIGSSDSEQHRSDGNDSDGSMLNLSEDLKTISYYIKDRERMLHEMFRCVRGHKLQAILPDALKTRSLDEIRAKCLDQLDILSKKRIRAILLAQPMTSSSGTEDSTDEDEQDFFTLYPHLKSSLDPPTNNGSNTAGPNAATTTPPVENNKKSLPNSKFRPVQMQAVTETPAPFQSNLSAPVVVGGDDDVRDYYEGFKHIKKLASLRRNQQDDELLPFPDQSGKILQPIGSNLPKFDFKPITSLTHSQQAHLNARRAAHRQQQQVDVRKEIDDLLNIDDFVLPDGERPISSAELSTNEQRRYGLPPRLQHKAPAGPPKKGSLGDLLKRKNKKSGERSPSPMIDETTSKRQRRQRSRSLSSTGSGKWSRSSSLSNHDERVSRHSSRELTPSNENEKPGEVDDDMTDLSKLLDLNEEDELLLLQIEVEQEERNIRREEKRRRKEEKKNKKINKKNKSSSSSSSSNKDDRNIDIQECLDDLIDNILSPEETKLNFKRTFDHSDNELSKKIKLDELS